MCTTGQALIILQEAVRACTGIFGGIHDAYLYGSYARGDFTAESDVDLLLTVDLPPEKLRLYRSAVASVSSDLSLKHDVTVSIAVKSSEQFLKYQSALPYYRNVIKEGIRYAV